MIQPNRIQCVRCPNMVGTFDAYNHNGIEPLCETCHGESLEESLKADKPVVVEKEQ